MAQTAPAASSSVTRAGGAAAGDGKGDLGARKRRRCNEHVLDHVRAADIQPYLAVQPAVSEIVQHEAERRHGGIFGRVEPHGEAVFHAVAHGGRDLHAKGRVAAGMLGDSRRSNIPRQSAPRRQTAERGACRDTRAARRGPVGNRRCRHSPPAFCIVQRHFPAVCGRSTSGKASLAVGKAGAPLAGEFPIAAKADHGVPPERNYSFHFTWKAALFQPKENI